MLQSPPSVTPHFSVRSLSCFYAIKLNITYITIKLPNINSGHDGTRGFALFTIAFCSRFKLRPLLPPGVGS